MALLNLCIRFKKMFGQKHFLKHYKNSTNKNFHNMSQGPSNPGFMQENVQKGDFIKKPSRELKNYFCFRFL
jgi:hypothetical protein